MSDTVHLGRKKHWTWAFFRRVPSTSKVNCMKCPRVLVYQLYNMEAHLLKDHEAECKTAYLRYYAEQQSTSTTAEGAPVPAATVEKSGLGTNGYETEVTTFLSCFPLSY